MDGVARASRFLLTAGRSGGIVLSEMSVCLCVFFSYFFHLCAKGGRSVGDFFPSGAYVRGRNEYTVGAVV